MGHSFAYLWANWSPLGTFCPIYAFDSLLLALAIEARERLSFWDSLIVAAAARGRASLLLSEDLSHGRTLAGVRVSNPFIE